MWKENFTARGSFRDVEFIIESDDLEFGRRKQVHEFPLRNFSAVEDLGRKSRKFSIECFVIGPEYMVARDQLIAAIEQPGPGVLVHPYFGTLNAEVIEAKKSETTRGGGRASFSLSFIETGEREFAFVSTDTQALVEDAAEVCEGECVDEFAAIYDTVGQVQEFVEGVQDELESALQSIEDVVGDVVNTVTDLILAPVELGSAIMGTVNTISNLIDDPLQALSVYEDLFDSQPSGPPVPRTTSNRIQQADNIDAIHVLIQRAAVIGACDLSARINFTAVDDALSLMVRLMAAIDDQVEQANTDGVYHAFQDLRAAVAEDLRVRGAKLPRVRRIENTSNLPALVIAYRVHNDVARESEIVERNKVSHPGFVPGGQPIEVLTDV